MNLTIEQVQELTSLINERMAEFGVGNVGSLSRGVVRLAHSVIVEWQEKQEPRTPGEYKAFMEGLELGRRENQRSAIERDRAVAIKLGNAFSDGYAAGLYDAEEFARDKAEEAARDAKSEALAAFEREYEREAPSIDDPAMADMDGDEVEAARMEAQRNRRGWDDDELEAALAADGMGGDSDDYDDDPADLGDDWPDMPDLSGPSDIDDDLPPDDFDPEHAHYAELHRQEFADLPVAGEPEAPPKSDEKITWAENDPDNITLVGDKVAALGPFGDYPPGDHPDGQAVPVSQVKPAPPLSPVTPLAERPIGRDRTQRHHESEAAKRRNELPSLDDLIAEVQRISMDKRTMPSLAQFDAARPAVWATADAHLSRHNLTWAQLAELAGLTPRAGGRPPRVAVAEA